MGIRLDLAPLKRVQYIQIANKRMKSHSTSNSSMKCNLNKSKLTNIKIIILPCRCGSIGWSIVLCTKMWQVYFPAHTGCGFDPRQKGSQLFLSHIVVSLSLTLSLSRLLSKINLNQYINTHIHMQTCLSFVSYELKSQR